jgi:hypothetical protein
MYRRLNPRWASTLWGCLAVVFACIPFILFKYGPKVRLSPSIRPISSPHVFARTTYELTPFLSAVAFPGHSDSFQIRAKSKFAKALEALRAEDSAKVSSGP